MNKFTLIFSLIFLISSHLLAQVQITGRVKDKDGQPIPGVNIVVKGTTKGTFSDADGTYKLINVPKDSTLVFSFIGMMSEEIKVGDQTEINVTLLEDITTLEDVVVVGYGVQKRADLTGAVTSITSKEIQDIPASNLSAALEGRLSGVRISQGSGKPGASTTLKIRLSSEGNIAPDQTLYVIDDIIRDKDAFDILDPSEVESISILKDASAAIYGVRGSGGVVLVKTKKGKQGKIKVNYSGSYGLTQAINTTKMLSAYDLATMLNDGYDVQKLSVKDPRRYSDDELTYFRDSIPNGGYNWLDEAWKKASLSRHNLNFSGGTEKIRYFVGGSYLNENGSIEGLYARKYTIRSNIDVDILKGLTASFEVSLGNRKDHTPINPSDQSSEIMEETFRSLLQNPQWVPSTINGLPVMNNVSDNPFAIWTNNEYNKKESNSSSLKGALEYKIPFIKGLSSKVVFNQSKSNSMGKIYYVKAYGYIFPTSGSNDHIIRTSVPADSSIAKTLISGVESLQESSEQSVSYQTDMSLNYAKKFGNHDINAIVVWEVGQYNGNRVGYKRTGAQVIPGVDEQYAFNQTDVALATNKSVGGSMSYVGRLNYAYASKYLLEFTGRYDASTKYSPKERWGFFPAVQLGYVVSEESFFKDNVSFINFLKLRGTGGLLGSDNINEFTWLLTYGVSNPVSPYLFGTQPVTGIDPKNGAFINPDVTWQKTRMYNGGLDIKVWDSKISFSFDYFYKYTYDELYAISTMIPTTVGAPTSSKVGFNYGKSYTHGYELELEYRNKLHFGLEYYIKGNFAWAETKKLRVAQSPGAVGKWYDDLKNYDDNQPGAISSGIVRTQAELDDIMMDNPNYNIGQTLQVGMLNYKDIRGTDGSEGPNGQFNFDQIEDRTIIAQHTNPPYIYGATLGVSFKGIRVDATFSGKFGNQVFYDKESMVSPSSTANVPDFWKDHWTPENTDAAYPRAYDFGLEGNYSTFWMRNGHTLRLTDLNVSYSLPTKWAQQFGVPELRLFFNTKYLWTIINPFDYKDANLSKYNGYPMTRTYNFGLTVSF
jgi:TonB-linked SusC/RagA family outer membrane protein